MFSKEKERKYQHQLEMKDVQIEALEGEIERLRLDIAYQKSRFDRLLNILEDKLIALLETYEHGSVRVNES